MSHTPAPWRVVTDWKGFPQHVTAENYETTCSFLTSVKRNCGVETIEANARLIAAAPDLLMALKDAHPHIEGNELRKRIGSVIAKAEGLTP